jgi:hypothetical protein
LLSRPLHTINEQGVGSTDLLLEIPSMRHITVEPALVKELRANLEQTILCDSTGQALGFFSPLRDPTPVGELNLEPPLSVEETERLRQNKTGKPLSEILGRLGVP